MKFNFFLKKRKKKLSEKQFVLLFIRASKKEKANFNFNSKFDFQRRNFKKLFFN